MARVIVNAKRAIFTAAGELLESGGYASMSMRGVAGRSGVALGTIYNYYSDKRELVEDMMLLHWTAFTEKQAAIAASRHSPYVRLYRLHQEFCRFARTFSQIWDSMESEGESPSGGAGYAERLAPYIEAMLAAEAKQGTMRLKLGARDTARFVAMNFMAMARMPGYHYELFEGVLKEIVG